MLSMHLKLSEDFPLNAQEVIDFFEDTYIGRLHPDGHRQVPLFQLSLWNVYSQTLNDLPRTNNAVEGWHHSFQVNVEAYYPNFWKFIDILKHEQNLTQVIKMVFLKTTNLPEVILVTIALSVSYALEKP